MAEEEAEEGAPAWLLTYGDMITLVLTFFVLLFTMSEIKKDKVSKTMRAFQKQFGVLPRFKSTVQIFAQAQKMTQSEANVLRRGPPGDKTSVQTLVEDERTKIIIGGATLFEPNRAELLPTGKQVLRKDVAPDLRGFKNRIEIRGHTATTRLDAEDIWYLGYRRAYAVMRFLVDHCDIDERRFRVVSCAANESLASNQTEEGRERNRRVEIIMTEESIKEVDQLQRP